MREISENVKELLLPEALDDQWIGLAEAGQHDFMREQENNPSLGEVREKAKLKKNRTMNIRTLY